MKLKDQVAIITGAGRNIGEEVALLLASEGAKVAVVDMDKARGDKVAEAIKAKGGQAAGFVANVADEAQVEKMVKDVVATFGGVDILVNNAAISDNKHMLEITKEEWDRVMEVNLKGVFLCSKAVIPVMKQQKRGKIINIASGTFFSGSGNMPHYTTAKGGVVALTRVMARQLGE